MFGPCTRAFALGLLVVVALACGKDDAGGGDVPDQLTFPAWSFDGGTRDGDGVLSSPPGADAHMMMTPMEPEPQPQPDPEPQPQSEPQPQPEPDPEPQASVQCSRSDIGCRCSLRTSPPSDPVAVCNPVSVGGTCCADANFPDGFGFCSCRSWGCDRGSSDCNCGTGSDGTSSSCESSYRLCCTKQFGTASTCYCDDFFDSCESDYTQVPNCNADAAPCGPGEVQVDSCSQ